MASLVTLSSCTSSKPSESDPSGTQGDSNRDEASCDPISMGADSGGSRCLLPWPNDFYTVASDSTTRERINFATSLMPRNSDGAPIQPEEWNRNDGFSPGSSLVIVAPGVDLGRSGLNTSDDIGASLKDDAAIVILDQFGDRHPYWAELDARAPAGSDPALLIRPAERYRDGTKYFVGVRNLKTANGSTLDLSENFDRIRDNRAGSQLGDRSEQLSPVFEALDAGGVDRGSLQLAWQFTTASSDNLTERLLFMRDDAFEKLRGHVPKFEVTEFSPYADGAALISGTLEVPSYLTAQDTAGSVLNNGHGHESSPLPVANGTLTARFQCVLPSNASADEPAQPTLFAFALTDERDEAQRLAGFGAFGSRMFCGTGWAQGPANSLEDATATLGDLSNFRSLVDRVQQELINTLFLGRLMIDSEGFRADPHFQTQDGFSLIGDDLVFVGVGNSASIGGALVATAQDFKTALLAFGGINYSMMLERSSDWSQYSLIYYPAYGDGYDRQIGLQLIQMLWDRAEVNGYASHLGSDSLVNTPAKAVMLFEAFGDHRVPNIQTEALARAIGARAVEPFLAAGRSSAVETNWGIDPVDNYPTGGPLLVMWDPGSAPPPTENVAAVGADPRWAVSEAPALVALVSEFLDGGSIADPCGDDPCSQSSPVGSAK